MTQKISTLLVVGIVVSLVVGVGIGSYMFPQPGTTKEIEVEKIPLDGQEVRIGYICTSDQEISYLTPLLQEIVQNDVNAYAQKMSYDVSFKYLIESSSGQAATHLEKIQGFKSIGVNVVFNSGSSGQVQATMPYINENNMLFWSATSTSPLLAAKDNVFRMIPNDLIQAPALAKVLNSYGVKAVVICQRADAYGDGIYNFFEPAFTELGGVVLERVRYQVETQEFSTYLSSMEAAAARGVEAYGQDSVGVLLIGGTTSVVMVTQTSDYPILESIPWFGGDSVALEQRYVDSAQTQALKVKLISTLPVPGSTEKYYNFAKRYFDLTGLQAESTATNDYDIGWVLTNTILQEQSVDPTDLVPVQSDFCYNYFGASGWTKLDENGDRAALDYNLYGVFEVNGVVNWYQVGTYHVLSDSVEWLPDVLGYTP